MPVVLRRLTFAGAALLAVSVTGASNSAGAPNVPDSFTGAVLAPPVRGPAERVGDVQPDEFVRLASPSRPPAVGGLRRLGTGSGFFVGAGRVLTNFHVVESCSALTVGNNVEGAETFATLVAGDRAVDLAVLSTDGAGTAGMKPARFQSLLAAPTSDTFAVVGYPEHGLPVLMAELDEVTVYIPDLMSDLKRYNFNGDVRRGNSGGPVLDATAAVVGVVTAQLNTPEIYRRTGVLVDDVGLAIANRTIFEFLRANQIEFELAAAPAPSYSSERLLEEARGFVRQIGCWR